MRRSRLTNLILSITCLATVLGVAAAHGRQDAPPSPPLHPETLGLPIGGMSAPAPTPPALPSPLPAGPAPDLDLVFTNQVAGWIEPCG